ncbi:L-serine ammonia-lyase, iron-sulfur-dependent, subunit alpha [Angelakisella massiliensis]|uniref:L-serine ammonia-lyase, iron-sulfur-dependent, subunit alpha n=1 Tax=Angelakisella massiliensis TaxID=1871018 RepID=UPI0008F82D52|nr:L-serine ammonia-lyase, iron-sulfur-dependent, subunit alpha [Angelakisella massiliensis]
MEKYQELYEILRKEMKPALGCTGPIGICFVAAQAYDAIGGEIKKIVCEGFGPKSDDVAFPGTEMLGAEMAAALGAVCGDPNAGLEVLHSVTPEGELKARKVAELVELVPTDDLDLGAARKITIETDKGVGVAVIKGAQDGLIYKARNGEVLLEKEPDALNRAGHTPLMKYKIKDFYEFATTTPIEKFDFILEAIEMNSKMSEYVLTHDDVSIGIGRNLLATSTPSPVSRAKAAAAAACEGRMSGVPLPIMSVGGKGNVGIASSMPLISLAKDLGSKQEDLQRALVISSLLATAVIHRIGKAPTMCSCEVAATMGVAVGAVLLQGGTEQQAENAIQNLIPNVFGVVCDGAKLACALRMASGTAMALDAAELALKGVRLANNQGVLDINADASIDFLGDFALNDMLESDKKLEAKMMEKRKIFPLMTFTDRQKQ